MADISHLWGNDLAVGATGDLALSSDDALTQQRVLRRLLTGAGDYIWQVDFGAGLPGLVGQPEQMAATQAVIRSQIFNETGVATSPEPVITIAGNQTGEVFVDIRYVDANSGATQALSFPVGS